MWSERNREYYLFLHIFPKAKQCILQSGYIFLHIEFFFNFEKALRNFATHSDEMFVIAARLQKCLVFYTAY